jgi:transcriptional regulator with XRE-family HTH domain
VISTHEEFRRRRGFTVTELARAIDFSHAYVSRVEGGDLRPSARYRAAVAKALRVPEDVVFDVEREKVAVR